jgi:hypothetical protein
MVLVATALFFVVFLTTSWRESRRAAGGPTVAPSVGAPG